MEARFKPSGSKKPQAKESYFLVAGAFVPYKRIDLAIKAFNRLGSKLIVAGSGPEETALRKMAKDNITFIMEPNSDKFLNLLQNAQALLLPGSEDFGLIPIEAMACGTPVIAYKEGGALDYIKPKVTGEFFAAPTASSLLEVIAKFKKEDYDLNVLVDFAAKFNRDSFVRKICTEIELLVKERRN